MNRNLALASLAVAAAVLTACSGGGDDSGSDSSGTQAFNLGVPGPTLVLLPYYVADDQGFFNDEGLDSQFITVASGAAMLSGVAGGQMDVVPGSLAGEMKLRQGGQDVQMIAGQNVGYNYTIHTRDGIDLPSDGTFEEKMKALEGLKIGAQGGPDGSTVPFAKALMSLSGADPSTIEIASVNYGGPQIAALQSGELDAVITDESTEGTLQKLEVGEPFFSMLTDPPAEYQKFMISGAIAKEDFTSANPEFAEGFAAAMDTTVTWMRDPANKDEVHRIATQVQGVTESATLDDDIASLVAAHSVYVDRPQLEASIDFLYSSGQLEPEPRITVDEFVAPSVIK